VIMEWVQKRLPATKYGSSDASVGVVG
jgi:hypothetical protein